MKYRCLLIFVILFLISACDNGVDTIPGDIDESETADSQDSDGDEEISDLDEAAEDDADTTDLDTIESAEDDEITDADIDGDDDEDPTDEVQEHDEIDEVDESDPDFDEYDPDLPEDVFLSFLADVTSSGESSATHDVCRLIKLPNDELVACWRTFGPLANRVDCIKQSSNGAWGTVSTINLSGGGLHLTKSDDHRIWISADSYEATEELIWPYAILDPTDMSWEIPEPIQLPCDSVEESWFLTRNDMTPLYIYVCDSHSLHLHDFENEDNRDVVIFTDELEIDDILTTVLPNGEVILSWWILQFSPPQFAWFVMHSEDGGIAWNEPYTILDNRDPGKRSNRSNPETFVSLSHGSLLFGYNMFSYGQLLDHSHLDHIKVIAPDESESFIIFPPNGSLDYWELRTTSSYEQWQFIMTAGYGERDLFSTQWSMDNHSWPDFQPITLQIDPDVGIADMDIQIADGERDLIWSENELPFPVRFSQQRGDEQPWATIAKLNDDVELAIQHSPALSLIGDQLYAVWLDGRRKELDSLYEWYFSRSSDFGATWTTSAPLWDEMPSISSDIELGVPGLLPFGDDSLPLLFGNAVDFYYDTPVFSVFDGSSWSDPTAFNEGTTSVFKATIDPDACRRPDGSIQVLWVSIDHDTGWDRIETTSIIDTEVPSYGPVVDAQIVTSYLVESLELGCGQNDVEAVSLLRNSITDELEIRMSRVGLADDAIWEDAGAFAFSEAEGDEFVEFYYAKAFDQWFFLSKNDDESKISLWRLQGEEWILEQEFIVSGIISDLEITSNDSKIVLFWSINNEAEAINSLNVAYFEEGGWSGPIELESDTLYPMIGEKLYHLTALSEYDFGVLITHRTIDDQDIGFSVLSLPE